MLAHRDSLSGFEFDAESNVVDADGATERRLDWTRINVGLTPSAVELIKSAGTSAKDVYKQVRCRSSESYVGLTVSTGWPCSGIRDLTVHPEQRR